LGTLHPAGLIFWLFAADFQEREAPETCAVAGHDARLTRFRHTRKY
jgi:hypothetical protein